MTAIVLPDIDRSTLEELQERMPSLKLSAIELPSLERAARNAGRGADRAIDRMLGRQSGPSWGWLALGLGLITILGLGAALFTWTRRASFMTTRGPWSGTSPEDETGTEMDVADELRESTITPPAGGPGLTAAESSLLSSTEVDLP
jgi:hypothetical protein